MKSVKQLISICLVLSIILSTGYFLATANLRFTQYFAAPCTESVKELSNPYIGWYQVQRYLLADTLDPDSITGMESGPGPVLLEFNLQNYADCPISDAGLQNLDTLLQSWEPTGRQLIVRFLYDWNGEAIEQEPDELSLILEHMSQTASVLNRYAGCIYILQGIFIGSWGEMHGSAYATKEDILTLMNHLSTVVSPDILLAVRTPDQWRSVTGDSDPLPSGQAFGTSLSARLGLFNDGMLGSDTDLNTYQDPASEEYEDASGKRSREEEIRFQNLLCTYVPNGGEVVINNPLNDFSAAASYLREIHVSYLNRSYDEAVLSKWKADTYTGEGPFYGMNGLDYIGRHLGYRYVLRTTDYTPPILPGNTGMLSLTLENTGFSGCYYPFELTLSLVCVSLGKTYTIPVPADTRLLTGGTHTALNVPLEIQDYAIGTYQLYLKITDPNTDCEIRLANQNRHTADGYLVGDLEIRSFFEFSKQKLFSRSLIGKTDSHPVCASLQPEE